MITVADLRNKMAELCKEIKLYNPTSDSELLLRAFDFAAASHGEQNEIPVSLISLILWQLPKFLSN